MIYSLTRLYRFILIMLGLALMLTMADHIIIIDSSDSVRSILEINGIIVASGFGVYFCARKVFHSFLSVSVFALLLEVMDERKQINSNRRAASNYLSITDILSIFLCGLTIFLLKIILMGDAAQNYKLLYSVAFIDALLAMPIFLFYYIQRSTSLYCR